jgi:hypothetical protein
MFFAVIGFVAGIWFTQINPGLAGSVLSYVENLSFIKALIN